MKRMIAFMLTVMLLLTGCSSSSGDSLDDSSSSKSDEKSSADSSADSNTDEESDPYAEPIDYSISFLYMDEGTDYRNDALTDWICEQYNVDIEPVFISNSEHAETLRTWIYGGTLPDSAIWENLNMVEYMDYIEQGLIAPLPDGWEEDYPNLYDMYVKTGIYENLQIDGKHYAIPHAVYCNFVDMQTPLPVGDAVFYRKDWAEKLGFDFADRETITISELKEYLSACIENDMAENGNTIGLSATGYYVMRAFLNNVAGINYYNGFVREEDAYVWGAEEYADGIVENLDVIREWYNEKLIDSDFYLMESTSESTNKLTSGLAAASFLQTHVHGLLEVESAFEAANEGKEFKDCIDYVILTADDGTLYYNEQCNYYTYTIFNPDIDEATMARILSIMDFFCTKEGQTYGCCGIKGQDWDYDENGEISGGVEYPSTMMWYFMSVLSDDFSFGNPVYDIEYREGSKSILEYMYENGTAIPYPYEYSFYSSDAKAQYSVDLNGKMVELVIGSEDIGTAWSEFVTQYDKMVDPLLEELNETYFR